MGLVCVTSAGASSQPAAPAVPRSEVWQLALAAGFRDAGGKMVNGCGHPSDPRIGFLDLSGDGRPEAIVLDKDAACHGGTGDWFAILTRARSGEWRAVASGAGAVTFQRARTHGWADAVVAGACGGIWRFNGAVYAPDRPCGQTPALVPVPAPQATARPIPAPAGASVEPGTAGRLAAADQAAAMRAGGFVLKGGAWHGCDGQSDARIAPEDVRDLNGDGRPEVVITDESTDCYGMTGQGFALVTQGPDGQWRKVEGEAGIPTFLKTGAGGWPDLEVGGPGLCHPVLRWNGQAYAFHHDKEERRGACRR
jgi:hypothetical protein